MQKLDNGKEITENIPKNLRIWYSSWTQHPLVLHYDTFGGGEKSTPTKLIAKSSRCMIAKGLLFSSILIFTVPPDIKKLFFLSILSKRLVFDHKMR